MNTICLCCSRPFTQAAPKNTYWGAGGMAPLCQGCWDTLTPEQRLPYYREVWQEWERINPVHNYQWEPIEHAVMEGK